MKTKVFSILFGLVLVGFLFVSCNSKNEGTKLIRVSVVETGGFEVLDNGVDIAPGENAVFRLRVFNGELTGTDYRGEYGVTSDGGCTVLTLLNVKFPTSVRLDISSHFRVVTYDENGGDRTAECTELFGGGPVTVTSDIRVHSRPNTANGIGWFEREGYTLECWNTAPDGSGERIGLGSRVTVSPDGLTLYAVWSEWTDESLFTYSIDETDGESFVGITGCSSKETVVTVPRYVDGLPVLSIADGAFADCPAEKIVLPDALKVIADGAFDRALLETLVMFDNIESFSDAAFADCERLTTLFINAAEAPYGYLYRRESCYADKLDLLINAAGSKKIVFYGGCSMWYNLDPAVALRELADDYTIINLGLNGTVSSLVQMEILLPYMEDGDLLFHTPEHSSVLQLMTYNDMTVEDVKLWSGIENNYDLFANVDMKKLSGVFESLHEYLTRKTDAADYAGVYRDSDGRVYMDEIGCIPFTRDTTEDKLVDDVNLDPDKLTGISLDVLNGEYRLLKDRGVTVLVSCACVNLDAVPEEQRNNVKEVDAKLKELFGRTECAGYVSSLWDYLYHNGDFYDTNYHLLTDIARYNTTLWVRDLTAWLEKEGA